MMNALNNLVTTYSFRGKDYLVNLNNIKNISGCIEIKVTDKKTMEEWQGSYGASYIENLTHKTGNYKGFETFVSMIKSGLLRTSQCVTLDLLTYDDLEMLRSRKSQSKAYNVHNSSQIMGTPANNRRYLIVTYTVEFDRIHYPLSMEYCGPPDPKILQETIERLEKQVVDLQNQLNGSSWDDITCQIDLLQKKVVDVTSENIFLKEQIKNLNSLQKCSRSFKENDTLMKSIRSLENKLVVESEHVQFLKRENSRLTFQLEEVLKSEKILKAHFNAAQLEPRLRNKEPKTQKRISSLSPFRNRSLENNVDNPFRRHDSRKVRSARSSVNIARSSSEDSIFGEITSNKKRLKQCYQFKLSPRGRASSPSFSDLSHNSGISRCACRNCLRLKYVNEEGFPVKVKTQVKSVGKAKLLKRIQSLEKLISGIALN